MWIFMNDAFVSAVQHKTDNNILVVRARFDQDLERLFPNKEIKYSDDTDYPCRVFVTKQEFADKMVDRIENIDYKNFKDSAVSKERGRAYAQVWYDMYIASENKLIGPNG